MQYSRKKILLFIGIVGFTGILETSCIPAVIGGAAGAVAVAKDGRTTPVIIQDTDATYQANNILKSDTALYYKTSITATVFNHMLLLTGQTASEDLKAKAEEVLRDIPHVTKIYNQIQIMEPLRSSQRANDSLITAKVKTRLLGMPDVDSNRFKIVTDNATVYVMGITNRIEAKMAIEVISRTQGVKNVVTLIQYTDKE